MKKKILAGVLAAVMVALIGINSTGVSAAQAPQLWSLVAHFEYANGFSYDYVVATHLSTSEVTERLQECGQGHRRGAGAVVTFHCYPVAE